MIACAEARTARNAYSYVKSGCGYGGAICELRRLSIQWPCPGVLRQMRTGSNRYGRYSRHSIANDGKSLAISNDGYNLAESDKSLGSIGTSPAANWVIHVPLSNHTEWRLMSLAMYYCGRETGMSVECCRNRV